MYIYLYMHEIFTIHGFLCEHVNTYNEGILMESLFITEYMLWIYVYIYIYTLNILSYKIKIELNEMTSSSRGNDILSTMAELN